MSIEAMSKTESKWYQMTLAQNPVAEIYGQIFNAVSMKSPEDWRQEGWADKPAVRAGRLCDVLAKDLVMHRLGYVGDKELALSQQKLTDFLISQNVAEAAAKVYVDTFVAACEKGITRELGARSEQIKIG